MATFDDISTPDADAPREAGDRWPPGARRTLPILLGVLLATAIPYAVVAVAGEPAGADTDSVLAKVAELRAWMPGDPAPFSTLFTTTDSGHAVAEAGMSRLSGASVPVEAVGALAALAAGGGPEEDGPDLAAPLVMVAPARRDAPDAGAAARPDEGADAGPAAVADADAGPIPPGDAGPAPGVDVADVGPAAALVAEDPLTRLSVPPEAWEGVTAEIEDPSGAMAHFYAALARTALAEPGAVTRITQWGDSAIAADGMTAAARRLLQRQFGDAGHGYALVAAGNPWYRRKDIDWTSSGWKTWEFIRKEAPDGHYGFGGVAAVGHLGAVASWATVADAPVGTRASRFEVWYAASKGAGQLEVAVDGQRNTVIDMAADALADKVAVVEVPDGSHTFRIKNIGGGATRVYGVVVERAGPGVVYDGIGIVGAREARQLWPDEAHFLGQLAQRRSDLQILMYGGNTLPDKISMASYQQSFELVVDRFKAGRPEASCLVMSPLDHGERYRGRIRSVPRIHDLMKVQREVALAKGCAWYSIFDAMGGEGAAGTWYDSGLASGDLAHPTAKGSKVLGALWYKSLMKGFAGWLATRPRTP